MDARDRAAGAAVAHVDAGMVVGLGTGDTAARAIRMLGARQLAIVAVATSERAAALGREAGIEVRAPDELRIDLGAAAGSAANAEAAARRSFSPIDVTIDGADEIDAALRLIKGGGGAHTREKMIARASKQMIVVADEGKRVRRLGERFRLPVEILPFAHRLTLARLAALGLDPELRAGVVTDNGNLVADCALGAVDLDALAAAIKATSGVVEHGLFLEEATLAYVGTASGVERLTR